ncbi:hypothetical protein [Streptomyces sp. NBC_01520]|uniref:hypothetical protein n=1 Tax=Streptomyces sp. NBC_01520 TaxID=2903892 RepID=UPI0038630C42
MLVAPFLLVAATTGLLYAGSYQAEKVLYADELRVPRGRPRTAGVAAGGRGPRGPPPGLDQRGSAPTGEGGDDTGAAERGAGGRHRTHAGRVRGPVHR